jgi:hypothetical protein
VAGDRTLRATAALVVELGLGVVHALARRRQLREQNAAAVVEYWVLNLKVGSRFRSVSLNLVRDFALEDPKMEDELDKALAALAGVRDQEKKPVTISFRGPPRSRCSHR